MQLNKQQIELVVEKVLSRLRHDNLRAENSLSDSNAERTSENQLQLFEGKVFAIEDIHPGISKLVLAPNTLVTPLARDELRKRNVVVAREPSAQKGLPTHLGRLVVLQCDSETSLSIALKDASRLLKEGRRILIASCSPHRLVCELNRNTTIKAALVCSAGCVAATEIQLEPNVWVCEAKSDLRAIEAAINTQIRQRELCK